MLPLSWHGLFPGASCLWLLGWFDLLQGGNTSILMYKGIFIFLPFLSFQHNKGDSSRACLIIFLFSFCWLWLCANLRHIVHASGCVVVVFIYADLRLLDMIPSMFPLLMVLCVCFSGALLTRFHPPRAVDPGHYSVFTSPRDTAKRFYALTPLMTFCSLDPKVISNNPSSFHLSFTSWL